MPYVIAPSTDDDLRFAHDLARHNMASYYVTHGKMWDTTIFEASWPHTENYTLFDDDAQIGVLRLRQDGDALYISDLQISSERQNRGAGTFALGFAERLAANRGLARIRLRVYADNPARMLYSRLGFRELSRDVSSLLFEKPSIVLTGSASKTNATVNT